MSRIPIGEDALAVALRTGDPEHIARIFEPVVRRMARAGLLRRDPDLLETTVGDVLLVVCRRHRTFAGRARVTSWLYVIVRRAVWRNGRRHARWADRVDELDDESLTARDPACREDLSPGARHDALRLLEARVPNPGWRRLWLLENEPGVVRTREELAAMTGYGAASIPVVLSRTRARLAGGE